MLPTTRVGTGDITSSGRSDCGVLCAERPKRTPRPGRSPAERDAARRRVGGVAGTLLEGGAAPDHPDGVGAVAVPVADDRAPVAAGAVRDGDTGRARRPAVAEQPLTVADTPTPSRPCRATSRRPGRRRPCRSGTSGSPAAGRRRPQQPGPAAARRRCRCPRRSRSRRAARRPRGRSGTSWSGRRRTGRCAAARCRRGTRRGRRGRRRPSRRRRRRPRRAVAEALDPAARRAGHPQRDRAAAAPPRVVAPSPSQSPTSGAAAAPPVRPSRW